MDIGKKIAEGRTSDIFEFGEEQILKIFKPEFSNELGKIEFERAVASQKTGFSVPKCYDLIEVKGRPAIIYEKVMGKTLLEVFNSDPLSIIPLTKRFSALHIDMHHRETDKLPSQKKTNISKIERADHLDSKSKKKIIEYYSTLETDNKLTHGDYHPDNFMITNSEPIVIDWVDSRRGHPLADVARSTIINTIGNIPDSVPGKNKIVLGRGIFHRLYLHYYFKNSPYDQKDLKAWLLPIAAARLQENIPEEIENLKKLIRKLITKL